MNAKTKALSDEAQKLTAEERIKLVEEILDSLHPTDPKIDRLWAMEARDRLEAYRRGEMKGRPFEEVLRKYQRS